MADLQITQEDMTVTLAVTGAEPPTGIYDIDWGDGNTKSGNASAGNINASHDYSAEGVYVISIAGRTLYWEFEEQVTVPPSVPDPDGGGGDSHNLVWFTPVTHRAVRTPSGAFFLTAPMEKLKMTRDDADALASAGIGSFED